MTERSPLGIRSLTVEVDMWLLQALLEASEYAAQHKGPPELIVLGELLLDAIEKALGATTQEG